MTVRISIHQVEKSAISQTVILFDWFYKKKIEPSPPFPSKKQGAAQWESACGVYARMCVRQFVYVCQMGKGVWRLLVLQRGGQCV